MRSFVHERFRYPSQLIIISYLAKMYSRNLSNTADCYRRSHLGSNVSSHRHSLQLPYQCLPTQCFRFVVGSRVGLGVTRLVVGGDGSTQMRPKNSRDVQSSLSSGAEVVDDACEDVLLGFGVADVVVLGSSSHPQKNPGVQVEVDLEVVVMTVVVDPGAALVVVIVAAEVVVDSSLQPNQPGVWHVDVDVLLVLEVLVVVVVVVLSSRQPNHPGVLHVSVRVRVVVEVLLLLLVVVLSVPLLS